MNVRTVSVAAVALLLAGGCKREEHAPGNVARDHRKDDDHKDHDHKDNDYKDHDALIRLTPEAIRTAKIVTAEASRKPLATGLSAPARITFPLTGVGYVAAHVPGRVSRIQVQLGQKVKKGAILGSVESPALGEARAAFLSANAKSKVADANFAREKELLDKGITSAREAREAESTQIVAQAEMNAAEARLHTLGLSEAEIRGLKRDEHYTSHFPLRSPLDGTVVEIKATPGQAVESTTTLFTVGDLTKLWAVMDVFEGQLAKLRVGQPVTITVNALPDRRFTGLLDYIGDVIEESSRTVHVRVSIANTDGMLKPGMFGTAEIATPQPATDAGSKPDALVIPRDAIQTIGTKTVVFALVGEGTFKAIEVRAGNLTPTEAEIISGLEPGTKVVIQGAFTLKSELSKENMGDGHSH